ncbi:plasmid mobilization protein [Elioraea sp.]|uniref:plasmid mobilization protein n=1 Tax=Elioraea sp. TaxID=2185103 RepID=UPI00307EE48D
MNTVKEKVSNIRFAADEYQAARLKAAHAGLSFSEFVRQAVARFNPPPKASFPVTVLATVQELNAIAVNFRQIATATDGDLAAYAEKAADKFLAHINATHTGSRPPLSPAGLERLREQGHRINAQAKAANAGQPVSIDTLRDALAEIMRIPAG